MNKFICECHNREFETEKKLKMHLYQGKIYLKNQKEVICFICKKTFVNEESLKTHLKTFKDKKEHQPEPDYYQTLICPCHNIKFKNKYNLISHIWTITNRERKNLSDKNLKNKNKKTWEGYIPIETNCQVCNEKIYYNRPDKGNPIYFDHRSGGVEKIYDAPSRWLSGRKRTPENEKIWESCNFGKLCKRCNCFLPTKDRNKFLINITKYILE